MMDNTALRPESVQYKKARHLLDAAFEKVEPAANDDLLGEIQTSLQEAYRAEGADEAPATRKAYLNYERARYHYLADEPEKAHEFLERANRLVNQPLDLQLAQEIRQFQEQYFPAQPEGFLDLYVLRSVESLDDPDTLMPVIEYWGTDPTHDPESLTRFFADFYRDRIPDDDDFDQYTLRVSLEVFDWAEFEAQAVYKDERERLRVLAAETPLYWVVISNPHSKEYVYYEKYLLCRKHLQAGYTVLIGSAPVAEPLPPQPKARRADPDDEDEDDFEPDDYSDEEPDL